MFDPVQRRTITVREVTPSAASEGSGPSRLIGGIALAVLALILALAPLPLGSARPLPWSVLALAAAILLVMATGQELLDPAPSRALRPLLAPLMLMALVFAWIVFQMMPTGLALPYAPIWSMAQNVLGTTLSPSISVDRYQSAADLLHLLTYVAIFFAAWRAARDGESPRFLLRLIGWIGAAYALYGIVVYSLGNTSILWLRKWAYTSDLTGTFVNRNSFATFLGLALVCNLALFTELFARRLDTSSRRMAILSAFESILSRGLWITLRIVLVGGALLLTHSRGGTISTLIAIVVLSLLIWSAPSLRGEWRKPLVVAIGLGTCLVGFAAGAGLLTRFETTAIAEDGRSTVYAETMQAIREHPIFGTGLGTFQFVYPAYQTPDIAGFYDLAHDDYLENTLDLGIPAALAFFAALVLLAGQCVLGMFQRRRNAIYPVVALAATVLVGVHAVVDFSLQIPAVAVTYAAILGIGVAQSVSTGRRRNRTLTAPAEGAAPR
jgi:O-antigen ligase